MKSRLSRTGIIITTLIVGLIIWQCGNKDETSYSKLDGKVLLDGTAPAGGAIVSISTTPNAANVVQRVVANADGEYAVIALENGTYYVNAVYEPLNNNNNLKSSDAVILTGQEQEVKISGNKTLDITLQGAVSSGTGMVDLADGWEYDGTHSVVNFEFPYDAANAIFTGHFNRTGIDEFTFDEQHPENTVIKAWVDIVSVETGAPSPPCIHGRDGITGCIAGTLKVEKDANDTVDAYCTDGSLVPDWPNETMEAFDLWGDASATTYEKQSSIVGSSGVATFEATSVKSFGTGYIATGDFTFAGLTKSVDLYFTYLEGYEAEDRAGVLTKNSSFYGWFKFAASADFGITSGHIGTSDITVKISLQFLKALE